MLGGRVAEVTRILSFLGLEPDPGRLECVRWCDVDMYRYRCTVQYSTGVQYRNKNHQTEDTCVQEAAHSSPCLPLHAAPQEDH